MKNKEFIIYSDLIKKDANIAVVSDLHFNSAMSNEKLDEIVELLKKLGPTQIAIPGDIYDPMMGSETYKIDDRIRFQKFIKQICSIADVYYTLGNIDQLDLYSNDFSKKMLTRLPDNFVTTIGNGNLINLPDYNMCITGINLDKDLYKYDEQIRIKLIKTHYYEYLMGIKNMLKDQTYNVFLCHDPLIIDVLRDIHRKDFDNIINLIISGHNHGGMFPNWAKPFVKLMGLDMQMAYPTYIKGKYSYGLNTGQMIVSEGITKYNSYSGGLQRFEKHHEGTVENIRILKR